MIYKKIENLWFRINKKIRFLLVGGFNTFLAFALFVFFVEICKLPYQLTLIIQYFITINISIFSMRYYVFKSRGNLKKEYSKAWGVYLAMLGFNYIFLYVLINLLEIDIITAQAIYVVVSTVITYLIHQNLTFRNI